MKSILAICGKSSSGKDYLKNKLLTEYPQYFNKMISDTSRPPREGEIDGVDYNFKDYKIMRRNMLNGVYLDSASFNGWYYASNRNQLVDDKINLGIFNIIGLRRLINLQDEFNIIPVYVQAPLTLRLERSIKREGKIKFEFFRRMMADRKDFKNVNRILSMFPNYNIVYSQDYKINQLISWLDCLGLL